MKLIVNKRDICDQVADVIVSTANPHLNISGGANGEILLRGGTRIQEELHSYLRETGKKSVALGTIVRTSANLLSCKYILHAVSVNIFYESSGLSLIIYSPK